jgi:hypothetical protein
MSTNVSCELPPKARLEDVAKVLAALIGHRTYNVPIPDSSATFARVDGYHFALGASPTPGSGYIVLDCDLDTPAARLLKADEGVEYWLSYSWNSSENGGLALYPSCSTSKIALCAGLVDFFGGKIDFNDCDSEDVNMELDPQEDIRASNDPLWSQFNNRILAIKPLTLEEIDKFSPWARYGKKTPLEVGV